jgi:hypothetical protein
VTPNSEYNDGTDEQGLARRLGKKVRFVTLALSDEENQISSVKRYKDQEKI